MDNFGQFKTERCSERGYFVVNCGTTREIWNHTMGYLEIQATSTFCRHLTKTPAFHERVDFMGNPYTVDQGGKGRQGISNIYRLLSTSGPESLRVLESWELELNQTLTEKNK